MRTRLFALALVLVYQLAFPQALRPQPSPELLQKYQPIPAPEPRSLVLKKGDRLAICGDSITEQKMYSRLIEDYLTACVPELGVTVRQYGWSGERAGGFLSRMTNDCLRFKPTIATTCYGMNDHEYRAYEERVGQTYRDKSAAIVEAFKANHVRVIQGSPGCVGKVPGWVKTAGGTIEDLNLSLCKLRNIGIELARQEKEGFADVFWPMLTAGMTAQKEYGTNYAIAGKDGVHPGWAGHTVMAYAFLKSFGLDGDLGTFTVDLKKQRMKASKGHEVVSSRAGEFVIQSSRYPFVACFQSAQGSPAYPVCGQDSLDSDSSIRSAMTLIPFNRELNRFTLVATRGTARQYQVTWGGQSKKFSAEALAKGINLAEEFPCNPFCEAFAKLDAAVAAKQAFETKQIKQAFHSPEARSDMASVVARTEAERAPFAEAVKNAFAPVTHTLTIRPE